MISIHQPAIENLPELAELFDRYRMFYHKISDVAGASVFLTERLSRKDSEIFVVQENDSLAGFTQLYPIFSSTRMKRYWLLNDLFVEEQYRKKGFAKLLIHEAQNLCRTTQACGILLETDKSNDIGNHLYPSCGFERYQHANFYEWENKIS